MSTPTERNHTMAVFCDFENIALGTRDAKYDKFDVEKVLERLLLKGHIVVKKAYCDWERYREFKKSMHEASFELIEIPHLRMSGKNSADIRMVVDALDLCYTKAHVDTFVVVSGDSDFSPLVSKLRENNKKVIGVGVKNSTSNLFISNCDEFIFYDDLVREKPARKQAPKPGRKTAAGEAKPESKPEVKPEGDPEKAIQLVVETADALIEERGGDETVWGSFVKQTLKRRQPGFSERFHGFRSFGLLLEAARDRGLLELTRDEKSGDYSVKSVPD
jgi:uncharacterized protein (TIGR00288 family)